MMLHKLRRTMINPERTRLTGAVEVDECFVGGLDRELRGGRQHARKPLSSWRSTSAGPGQVAYACRLSQDASTATLTGFVREAVEAGAVVHTDGWNS